MQIEFYMGPADEREFLSFVRSTGRVRIIQDQSPTNEVNEWLLEFDLRPELQVRFWNQDLPGNVVMKPLKVGHGYYLSQMESDAVLVEYIPSQTVNGALHQGRIWCDPLRFGFPDAGRKWFNQIASWLRRRSGGVKHYGMIVLPHTAKWAETEGRLP